jgi:predicted nucleic acid-binding Zn ribbon protein/DNA-binding CsgD family transcriptional regulator
MVPVYVYRREDGSTFELQQHIAEDSLDRCPTTGQRVERVLQPFSPRYTGTGFYSPTTASPGHLSRRRTKAVDDGGCIVSRVVMPWLVESDMVAAHGFARSIGDPRTEEQLRGRALRALADLVPADVLTWDRVELATGAVRHTAVPEGAEPGGGAFEAIVANAAGHPLLAAHAAGPRSALRLSDVAERDRLTHDELYGDFLHAAGVEYEIAIGVRTGRGEAVIAGLGRTEREFSARDRDVLDIVRAQLQDALRATQARARLARALAGEPPPDTAVVVLDRDGEIQLSSPDASRWLAEYFGVGEHPGWLPAAVAEWLGLPPRPPLVSEREGRRLTVCLIPGDPHALLLEEAVAGFRPDALDRLGLTARETEVLRAATVIEGEAELAWELFLSLHAVRERLAHVEAKLGVRTAGDAVARALRESL